MNTSTLNDEGIFLMIKMFLERLHSEITGSKVAIELDDGAIMSLDLPKRGNSHIYWYRVDEKYDNSCCIKKDNSFLSLKNKAVAVDIQCDDETVSVPCEYGYFIDINNRNKWPDRCKERRIAEAMAVWLCAREIRKEMRIYHGPGGLNLRRSLQGMENVNLQRVANAYENHFNVFLKGADREEDFDAIATALIAARHWVENSTSGREKCFSEIADIIRR